MILAHTKAMRRRVLVLLLVSAVILPHDATGLPGSGSYAFTPARHRMSSLAASECDVLLEDAMQALRMSATKLKANMDKDNSFPMNSMKTIQRLSGGGDPLSSPHRGESPAYILPQLSPLGENRVASPSLSHRSAHSSILDHLANRSPAPTRVYLRFASPPIAQISSPCRQELSNDPDEALEDSSEDIDASLYAKRAVPATPTTIALTPARGWPSRFRAEIDSMKVAMRSLNTHQDAPYPSQPSSTLGGGHLCSDVGDDSNAEVSSLKDKLCLALSEKSRLERDLRSAIKERGQAVAMLRKAEKDEREASQKGSVPATKLQGKLTKLTGLERGKARIEALDRSPDGKAQLEARIVQLELEKAVLQKEVGGSGEVQGMKGRVPVLEDKRDHAHREQGDRAPQERNGGSWKDEYEKVYEKLERKIATIETDLSASRLELAALRDNNSVTPPDAALRVEEEEARNMVHLQSMRLAAVHALCTRAQQDATREAGRANAAAAALFHANELMRDAQEGRARAEAVSEEKDSQLANLSALLAVAQGSMGAGSEEVEKLRAERRGLTTRCEKAAKRVGELSSLLEDTKAQVAALEAEVEHQKQRNVEVSRQLDISVNAVLTGERLIQQLMEDVKNTRAQCGNAERCVVEGDARIKDLSQEIKRVSTDLSCARDQATSLRGERDAVMQSLEAHQEDAKAAFASLQAQLADAHRASEDAAARTIAELSTRTRLDSDAKETGKMEWLKRFQAQQANEAGRRVADLEGDVASLQAQISDLESQRDALSASLTTVGGERDAARGERDALVKLAEAIRSERDEVVGEREALCLLRDALTGERDALLESLRAADKRCADKGEDVVSL